MPLELKQDSGLVFPNDRKEKDTHPDWKGEINVEGKRYWVSMWQKISKNTGKKFFSMSVTIQDGESPRRGGRGQSQTSSSEWDQE